MSEPVTLYVESKPAPVTLEVNASRPVTITTAYIQGPSGAPGGATFQFDQLSPSSFWHIVHNLGRFPSITVIDSAGDIVWGDMQYIDSNVIDISFAAPFSGTAYLN